MTGRLIQAAFVLCAVTLFAACVVTAVRDHREKQARERSAERAKATYADYLETRQAYTEALRDPTVQELDALYRASAYGEKR